MSYSYFRRAAFFFALLLSLSIIGFSQTQAPSTYSAYTGTDAKTVPPAPALGPANSVINDPTFGTPILRVTDPNTNGGESFVPSDSGFHRSWNADSTAIKLTGPHGDGYWLEFNPSTFKVGDGSAKPVPHQVPYGATWDWSAVDPNVMYVLHGNQIAKYNKATGVTTDLGGPSSGEPVAYAAVVIGQDNWVCAAAGSGYQDSYTKIYCVNPNSPGTNKFIDVYNKTINGAAQGDPNWPQSASGLTLGIHDVSGGTGPNWLEVTLHQVNWGGNGGAVLNLATNTWSKITATDIYWSGHTSMGNGLYANSSGSQDGHDSRGILLRNPDNLMNAAQYNFIGQPAVTNNNWCDADHISWLNSVTNPNAPILVSRYMANVPNCALELTGEIYAAAVDGSGTIYRFAHNHDGGCYYSEGFTQISNDGNWALFSSYWDGGLGPDTSFGCTTRIDTFILKLTPGSGSSASTGTTTGGSSGGTSGTSSSGSSSSSGSTTTSGSSSSSTGSTGSTSGSTPGSTGGTSTPPTGGTSGGTTATAGSGITRYEETSNSITYTGSWNSNANAAESGGTAVMAMGAGSSATFNFNGPGANWIGFGDEYSGIANVYVDGVAKGQIDTYHSPTQYQVLMYSITGLSAGNHTLKVEVANAKNAASKGLWVWVDAFEVNPTSTSGSGTGSSTSSSGGTTTTPSGGSTGGSTTPPSGGPIGGTTTAPSGGPIGGTTTAPSGGPIGGTTTAPSGGPIGGTTTAPSGGPIGGTTTPPSGGPIVGTTSPIGGGIPVTSTPSGSTAGSTTTSVPPTTVAGGSSAISAGTSPSMQIGYGVITGSSNTPAGMAIFGYHQGGVLVSEAGVPASGLIQQGRIFAEVGGVVNTGFALANPNNSPANISFYVTDGSGNQIASGNTQIPASGQMAKFLSEAPYSVPQSTIGTFTFSSDVPVAAIALRGYTNERSEFLVTTLPIANPGSPVSGTLFFPHFAWGGGWATQFNLVNPSDSPISGSLNFYQQGTAGSQAPAMSLSINGQTATSVSYSIPARSSVQFVTTGQDSNIHVGSAQVVPAQGSAAPGGNAVFSFNQNGIRVSEAGVPLQTQGTAFRMYVESSSAIQSGIAVLNNGASDEQVAFDVTGLDGSPTGLHGTVTVPAGGQRSLFINQIAGLAGLPQSFKGIVRVSTPDNAGIVVFGLRGRWNERGEFLVTTTTPTNEAESPKNTIVFPHIVDGGGYTTQFVQYSGTSTEPASGSLQMYSQNGAAMSLPLQ